MQRSCEGCGKPVMVGDEDTCSGTDVIHEVLMFEPDKFWHTGCWIKAYKQRPHRELTARQRADLRWSA